MSEPTADNLPDEPEPEQTLAEAAVADGDTTPTVAEQGERLAVIVEREREPEPEPEPEGEPEPQADPFTRRCPTCHGYGKTLTGSVVEGQDTRVCPTCGGIGYQERRDVALASVEPAEAPVVDGQPLDGGWQWGTPS